MIVKTLGLAVVGGAWLALAGSPAQAQCNSFVLAPADYTTGSSPIAIDFGDVDGDHKIDMVLVDNVDLTCSILLGKGDGTFAAPSSFHAGSSPFAVALGDLDGDGDLDLAVSDRGYLDATGWHAYGVSIFWNTGGVFATSTFLALPSGEIQPTELALGDLDRDGKLDVVVALHGTGSLHSKVASFVNQGGGAFGSANLVATGYDPIGLALADLDGDGFLDAVTANSFSGSMTGLRGVGNGTFVGWYGHATGPNALDVALGDFDGDGHADGAIAYRYGVHVLRNVAGVLTWVATLPAGVFPTSVAFADLNGDTKLDLVAVDELGSQLFVWLGDGTGNFTPYATLPANKSPVAVLASDVDSDGAPDLGVALAGSGFAEVLHNTCPLSTYCIGKPNSLGCTPQIASSGTPSLSGSDDFHVLATSEVNHKTGVVFFGSKPASTPFAGGTLCVKPPLKRTPAQDSGGTVGAPDCSGAYDFHVGYAWLAQHGFGAGTELFTQYWSRDPQNPDGTGVALSNGLRFILQP